MSENIVDEFDVGDAAVVSVDDVFALNTFAQAHFAATVRTATEYVEKESTRPLELAPYAEFDDEAAEKSAVAEIAARLAVPGSTVTEWLLVYRSARPRIRKVFDAGGLAYSKFRTLCRTLAGVPNVTDELIDKVLAAAGRCTQNSLTSAVDKIIAEFDADWHREAREKATAERTATARKLPRGQGEVRLRGPQERVAAMHKAIRDAAKKVCTRDPRQVGARWFDAADTLITGVPFRCLCDDETCLHRTPDAADTTETPQWHAYVVLDALTAAGLSGEPGYIEGWGEVPPDVARKIAGDATWQALITEARKGRPPEQGSPPEQNSPPDPSLPEVRRGRRTPPGWTADTGPVTRSRAHDVRQQALDFYRLVAEKCPRVLDKFGNPTGHGGYTTPPPGALTHAPSEALRLIVQSTYETCVHPGCTVPSTECDLDHAVPFDHDNPEAGGWTVFGNLEPLCRTHHGLKTRKQWTYRILTHGIVHIRDPHGRNYFTAPSRVV